MHEPNYTEFMLYLHLYVPGIGGDPGQFHPYLCHYVPELQGDGPAVGRNLSPKR